MDDIYYIIGTAYAGKSTMVSFWQKNMKVLPVKRIIMIG